MNANNSKGNDSFQLQQMIIFLKAELAKYKYEVKKYQEKLMNEKNELFEDLYRANKEITKRTSDFKERLHLFETQNKNQITSIQTLQRTITDLRTANKQLTEVNKSVKERFDQKFFNLLQETYNKLHSQIIHTDLTNQERSLSDKINLHLLKEIEQKNSIIEHLQQKIDILQNQNDSHYQTITIDSESLMQLDKQIKKLLDQSLDFEEQLNTKFIIINTLDDELNQLTTEINELAILSPLLKKS